VVRQLQYEMRRLLLIMRWFVTGRRFDVWMARHAILGISLVAARLVARRVVLEVNGPVKEEMRVNFGSRPAAWVADVVFRLQLAVSHAALAVTPGLANYLRGRRPTRRVLVLPNGADPQLLAQDRDSKRDGLVFAGALTPWYALDVVLRALAQLRDRGDVVRLEVLGDGIERRALEAQVSDLGLEGQVSFRGWVEPSGVADALAAARVGVLPLVEKSVAMDVVGSPLKLYEYAASGLRVVGTNIDGVRETPVSELVHVYEARDVGSCAAAIEDALSAPSRRLPAQAWSWDARATDLLTYLQRMG
jgi:glycosyltransferase involved in cell wall biosynthesis